MKIKLAQYVGKKLQLTGIFNEITFAKAAGAYSVLIKPVYMNGHILCDHAWITISEESNPFKKLEINKYDEIRFEATAEQYIKSGNVQEYGLKEIKYVEVVRKGNGNDYVSKMKNFSFRIKAEEKIKTFGGETKVIRQTMNKPLMSGIYLSEGENVTCEFTRVYKNRLEFKLRTEKMGEKYWVKKVYFNPLKTSQTLSVRGYFSILLPPQVYSDLKRAYFKIFCTKTEIATDSAA